MIRICAVLGISKLLFQHLLFFGHLRRLWKETAGDTCLKRFKSWMQLSDGIYPVGAVGWNCCGPRSAGAERSQQWISNGLFGQCNSLQWHVLSGTRKQLQRSFGAVLSVLTTLLALVMFSMGCSMNSRNSSAHKACQISRWLSSASSGSVPSRIHPLRIPLTSSPSKLQWSIMGCCPEGCLQDFSGLLGWPHGPEARFVNFPVPH